MDLEMANQAAAAALDGVRKERRLSQEELAEKAGVPLVTVQRVLSGRNSMKVGLFLKLTEAIGADAGDVVARAATLIRAMSLGAGTNVTPLKRAKDMSTEEVEDYAGAKAADKRDPESDVLEDDN